MKRFFGFLIAVALSSLVIPDEVQAGDVQEAFADGLMCHYALALPNATVPLTCNIPTSIPAVDIGSTIPTPGVIPITGSDGKLAAGFVVDRDIGCTHVLPPSGTIAAWSFDESIGTTSFANAITGGSGLCPPNASCLAIPPAARQFTRRSCESCIFGQSRGSVLTALGGTTYADHGYWGIGRPPGNAYGVDSVGDLIVDNLWIEPVARAPAEPAARYKVAPGLSVLSA